MEHVKAQAAERWVRAVNADETCGNWRYRVADDVNVVGDLITTL